METETLAPWAELAPQDGPMSVDDLLALPDDGWQYELVEGRLVRMPGSGGEASTIGLRIAAQLLAFADAHGSGRVTGADGTYDLTPPGTPRTRGTGLVPDAAFLRADRVPATNSPDYDKAWPVADLVVEVASPNQYRPAMAAKAQRYLAAGVRLVWIVWPKRREIDVWRPGDTAPSRTLGVQDTLDGETVLPGFSYPVARVFA